MCGEGRTKKLNRPNGTLEDKSQYNFTDPQSRIMKTSSGGFEQSYNAQIGVDAKRQIIVATGVTKSAADVGELIPTLDRAEKVTGLKAKRMQRKLNTKRGRKRYKARKHVVEPAFAWIKHVLGFRGFSMRSIKLARAEFELICLCTNLRRMNRLVGWN
ncbi:MAG: hypothetical protein ACI8QZ_001469 [Chlamydiales bacterium]|jgi:hypothetical protein